VLRVGGMVQTGKIVVGKCKEYTSEAEFAADAALHLACDSDYRFTPGK
jgi:NAD(P)H-hydrate repair Nnr-like enzyme with NAD(P)H-hydrate dehydratase domain